MLVKEKPMKYELHPMAIEAARRGGVSWMTTEQPSYEALVTIINYVVDVCAEQAANTASDNPEVMRGSVHSCKVIL